MDDIRLDSDEDFSKGGWNVITATDNSPSQDLTDWDDQTT